MRRHTVQRLINDRKSLSGTCDTYHIHTDVMKAHMVVNYNASKRSTDLDFLENIFKGSCCSHLAPGQHHANSCSTFPRKGFIVLSLLFFILP